MPTRRLGRWGGVQKCLLNETWLEKFISETGYVSQSCEQGKVSTDSWKFSQPCSNGCSRLMITSVRRTHLSSAYADLKLQVKFASAAQCSSIRGLALT